MSLYFHLRTVVRLCQSFFMYANTIENMKTTHGKVYTFITTYCKHSLYLQILIKILLLPPNFCLLSSLLWFLLKCLLLGVQLKLSQRFPSVLLFPGRQENRGLCYNVASLIHFGILYLGIHYCSKEKFIYSMNIYRGPPLCSAIHPEVV